MATSPVVCFSVNVVGRKPRRNRPDTNAYMPKFLRQIDWNPDFLVVFAGEIDYWKCRFFDCRMICTMHKETKGVQ